MTESEAIDHVMDSFDADRIRTMTRTLVATGNADESLYGLTALHYRHLARQAMVVFLSQEDLDQPLHYGCFIVYLQGDRLCLGYCPLSYESTLPIGDIDDGEDDDEDRVPWADRPSNN